MDKTIQNKVKLVVAALGIIVLSKNAVALIISHLIINFPEQSVVTSQLVFTILSGMSIVGSLSFGVLSTKITKKNLAILFLSMITGGAAIGVIFGDKSIAIPFLSSILIGLGLGIIPPLIASIISEFFPDAKERAGAVALQAMFTTLGGVLYPIIGGILTAKYWTYNYFVFFISIPLIILVLILLPKGTVEPGTKTNTGEKIKVLTPGVKCWVFEIFIACICFMAFNANITLLMKSFELPNFVQMSSYALFAFSGGGLIVALILPKVCMKFGKPIMTYGLGLVTIGLFLMYFCRTPEFIWLTLVAGTLIGLGIGTFISSGYVFIPQSVDRRAIPKVMSLFVAGNALGCFVHPYVITGTASLINTSLYTRFLLAGFLSLGITIFAFATRKIKESNWEDISQSGGNANQ